VGQERQVVSVFGSGDPRPGETDYELAMAVGKRLAELGYAVANGGYGGTMEASARGAMSAGGDTIGVTCSIWSSSPNKFIDRMIATASLQERLSKLIELGRSGYVVLPGATGTLAELAWVWELSCKGLMQSGPRPIVCVGPFWRPLIDMMNSARPSCADSVTLIDSPEELETFFPSE